MELSACSAPSGHGDDGSTSSGGGSTSSGEPRGGSCGAHGKCSSGGGSDNDSDKESDRSDGEWDPPCTLLVAYWKRSEAVERAKRVHISRVDDLAMSREELILSTTLRDCAVALEVNMFPYETPPAIKHFTLWSRNELSHAQICQFVTKWCRDHANTHPAVVAWNYEENKHRSIDVPHVHVFLCFDADEAPTTESLVGGDCSESDPGDDIMRSGTSRAGATSPSGESSNRSSDGASPQRADPSAAPNAAAAANAGNCADADAANAPGRKRPRSESADDQASPSCPFATSPGSSAASSPRASAYHGQCTMYFNDSQHHDPPQLPQLRDQPPPPPPPPPPPQELGSPQSALDPPSAASSSGSSSTSDSDATYKAVCSPKRARGSSPLPDDLMVQAEEHDAQPR